MTDNVLQTMGLQELEDIVAAFQVCPMFANRQVAFAGPVKLSDRSFPIPPPSHSPLSRGLTMANFKFVMNPWWFPSMRSFHLSSLGLEDSILASSSAGQASFAWRSRSCHQVWLQYIEFGVLGFCSFGCAASRLEAIGT